jgi:hypothetical protein
VKPIRSARHAIIARPRARMLIAAVAAAVVLSGAAAFGPGGPNALALTEYSTPAITVAGGNPVIAIQTSGDGLQFFRNQAGTSTWRGEPVAGNHSTYSAPSIAQDGNSVIIAAQGPNNSLDFYWQQVGATGWNGEKVAGAGTTYSAPSLAVNGGGVNIVAQGSGNSLDFYWELNGTTAWHPVMVAGVGTTYSAPAVAANGGGANVVAEGPRNTLDFYWNLNGTTAWHPETIPGAEAVSAPSITTYSDEDGQDWVGVAAQGPLDSLLNYVNANGSGIWLPQVVSDFFFAAGSAPTVTVNNGSENIAAFGASGNLLFYGPGSNGLWQQEVVSRVT